VAFTTTEGLEVVAGDRCAGTWITFDGLNFCEKAYDTLFGLEPELGVVMCPSSNGRAFQRFLGIVDKVRFSGKSSLKVYETGL
jgi:hypothetical protein